MTFAELAPELPIIAIGILIADFLRYFIAATLVYVLVWRLFARRLKPRRILPEAPDVGQMRREFANSMSTVCIFALTGLCIVTLDKLGHASIYWQVESFGWPYWWASLGFMVIAHDTYFYWTHRWLHRPWWFAHVHHVHHQSVQPTPWAAYSFHPVEAAIHALFGLIAALFIPLHHAVLFVFTTWMILRNVIGHCGYELFPWRMSTRGVLRSLVTNSHHHFHHAYGRGNYALYFTWWDRLMATENTRYIANGDARFLERTVHNDKAGATR